MDIKTLSGNNPRPEGTTSGTKVRGTVSTDELRSSSASTSARVSESVTLTATAKTMSAALETAQDVPFDETRVAQIKTAIAEGRYSIDNQALADSLLSFEGSLS